jgi:YVTN family beta-propeller protein
VAGNHRRTWVACLCAIIFSAVAGCGGGGGSNTPPTGPGTPGGPGPTPSFSIGASPSPVALFPNATAQLSLTVTEQNSFSGAVTVSISGLPAGVSATPASPFALTSSSQNIVLAADGTAKVGTYSLGVQGSSGSTISKTTVSLNIATGAAPLPGNRTNFVATNDVPSSEVYDPVHGLVYAALPNLSRVDVIDPTSAQIVRTIPVPVALGLSLTPDGSRVLVSGYAQQVAWIDTASQQVVERDVTPVEQTDTSSLQQFFPSSPIALASGKVLFFGSTGFLSGIAEWDPIAQTAVQINPSPQMIFGQGTFGVRSADGTKVIFSSGTSPSSIAIFDSTKDGFVASLNASDYAFAVAANPNGTQFAVAIANVGTYFMDNQLNILATVPVSGAMSGMVYSADGKSLYAVSAPGNVPLIFTIDTLTYQLVGEAPAYATNVAYVERVPPLFVETPLAADSTGMLFGVGDHGVVLDDSTFFQSIPLTAYADGSAIINPAEGPQNSYTTVTIPLESFSTTPDIWFGTVNGINLASPSGQAQATALPSSSAGPVNVKIIYPDGREGNVPQGFTYGAVSVESPTLAAPPGGGVLASIFGYGFGSDVSSPVHVQFGGNSGSTKESLLFPAEYSAGYPFPLDHILASVPGGSPGPVDITITSTTGTMKIPSGLRYLQDVADYPSSDVFQFILYDATRQQLYLSATDHIDVFSLINHSFAAPIEPPSLGGTRQIEGLAITPDGSKLLAANYSDNSVAIIDPDNPATAQAVQIVPTGSSPYTEGPTELAATSTNYAFIMISNSNGISGGGGVLYDLDLSSLAVTTQQPGTFVAIGGNCCLSSSRDGSKVFVAFPGYGPASAGVWDATTSTWSSGNPSGGLTDAAASGDGNVFAATAEGLYGNSVMAVSFVDASVHALSMAGLPEYLYSTPAVQGMKFNDAGSLLYVPVVASVPTEGTAFPQNAIDIFDVSQNQLRERVLLSEQFAPQLQALTNLAIDPTGQNIFLITETGLTIATLDAVPLSVGSVTPLSGSAGTTVTIRGSGFSSTTKAMFNGTTSSVTFVDADTLQATIPSSLAAGPVSVTLNDSDGFTYTLDAAFNVN